MVEGDTLLDLSISSSIAPKNRTDMTPNLTANRPISAIHYVGDAPSGIATTVGLPNIVA